MRHSAWCVSPCDRLTFRALRRFLPRWRALAGWGPFGFAAAMGSRAGTHDYTEAPTPGHRARLPAMLDLETLARRSATASYTTPRGCPSFPAGSGRSSPRRAGPRGLSTRPRIFAWLWAVPGCGAGRSGPGGPGASYRSRPSPRPAALIQRPPVAGLCSGLGKGGLVLIRRGVYAPSASVTPSPEVEALGTGSRLTSRGSRPEVDFLRN